jgi:hypothetical protein
VTIETTVVFDEEPRDIWTGLSQGIAGLRSKPMWANPKMQE